MTRKSVIRTTNTEIKIDDEGILRLKAVSAADLDLHEVMECFAWYDKLGIGNHNKVLQLIDVSKGGTMSQEARDYAAEIGRNYFLASAVVSNSLSVRLVVNFFNRFYKHDVPFKLFKTEEKALGWLRGFRK
jgi:hypothetical protein